MGKGAMPMAMGQQHRRAKERTADISALLCKGGLDTTQVRYERYTDEARNCRVRLRRKADSKKRAFGTDQCLLEPVAAQRGGPSTTPLPS